CSSAWGGREYKEEAGARAGARGTRRLFPRSLYCSRGGAFVPWVSGFLFLGYSTPGGKEIPANAGTALLLFLVIWSAAFTILAFVFRASVAAGALKHGRAVALVGALVVIIATWRMSAVAHQRGA